MLLIFCLCKYLINLKFTLTIFEFSLNSQNVLGFKNLTHLKLIKYKTRK